MGNLRRVARVPTLLPVLGVGLCLLAGSRSLPADEWTQFRGPNGQGRCASTDLPVSWSEHQGIVWKTPIAGRGWSSPVTLDGNIWLTTATESGHSLRALCLAADTGKIRWDVEVFHADNPQYINAKNSHASPSPIVEPGRLYVHFGAAGTACLDSATGKILWRNQDLVIDHGEGAGSSPILFEDLLIVNCDGTDRQFVVALSKQTGQIAWKSKRSISVDETPRYAESVFDAGAGRRRGPASADQPGRRRSQRVRPADRSRTLVRRILRLVGSAGATSRP